MAHLLRLLPANSESSNAGRQRESRRSATDIEVSRSFDPADINRIVNDPSVYPSVALPGGVPIDLTGVIENTANILLTVPGGALLFVNDGFGIYEVHTNFLEDYRGRYAIEASFACYRWMFAHTDCMAIQTRIPALNRRARMAAGAAGFTFLFERTNVWPRINGGMCNVRFYNLPYESWLRIDSIPLILAGKRFHEQFEAERSRLNVKGLRNHPDEPCHDLYAGVCAEMIYGGQPEKAVFLYNRWARFAGYGQIALIARNPLLIDIGDAIIQIGDRNFKVIKCR